MTFLAVKLFLKKAWLWIKNHSELVVGLLTAIFVGLFLVRNKSVDFAPVLAQFRAKHKQETDFIEEAHQEELKDIERSAKIRTKSLKIAKAEHDDAKAKLDAKKQEEIVKVIEEAKEDPDAITNKLAKLTGFSVVDSDD